MPKAVEDCVAKLIKKGYPEKSAYPICISSIMGKNDSKDTKKKKDKK